LNRGTSRSFGFVFAASAWPSSAAAAEGLNLFPDPIQVAVNVALFAILIFPVTRLLLRPLVSSLEERERRTTGALARVDTLLGEAAQMRETFEARMVEARERAAAQRGAVLQQAEAEERRILTEARAEAARALEEARETIAGEVAAAREELRADADALAREIASGVLGRKL
jgi:F-type H+-transporting ATPase subunit b